MDNYKIKVNDEAESKEAQELFEQLGFTWAGDYPENGDWYSHLYAENSTCCYLSPYVWNGLGDKFQELTLSQLRDLVVLHRNDPKDANVQQDGDVPCLYDLYLTEDKELYFYHCGKGKWIISNLNHDEDYYRVLKPIQKQQPEQGLISGADALRALADGKEVDFLHDSHGWVNCLGLNIEQVIGGLFKLRLKPRTIKLSIEIPAPFEPSECEEFYVLSSVQPTGYIKTHLKSHALLGAWRTEEEIKQVVASLRGIKG